MRITRALQRTSRLSPHVASFKSLLLIQPVQLTKALKENSSALFVLSPMVREHKFCNFSLCENQQDKVICVQCLSDCRETISKDLGLELEEIELSMGMSGDFEQAVSWSLRVTLAQDLPSNAI